MGRVFKKNDGTWGIRYDLPESTRENRKQKQISGFKSEREAKKALTKIEAKILNGTYFTDNKITVEQMLDIWMKDHVRLNLAPKTILFYENYVDVYLKPYLGYIKLSELKPNHITAFYSTLTKEGKSQGILNKCHRTLRACLYSAYNWEYTDKKVIDKVKAPNLERKIHSFWDEDTIKQGIKYFENHAIEFHVIVALNLGLRQGEICGLMEKDIDFKNKTLTITRSLQKVKGEINIKKPKTESSKRILPLSDYMITIFRNRSRWIKKNILFFGEDYNKKWTGFFSVTEKGDIIDDQKVCGYFRRALKKSNLPKVTFHDLRHSCASWLLFKGASMKDIQEILGHSNMSTTADIYSHVTLDKKREFLNKLN